MPRPRLAPARVTVAVAVGIAVVLALGLLISFGVVRRAARRDAALDLLEDQRLSDAAEMKRQLDEQGYYEPAAGKGDTLLAGMYAAAEKVGGTEGRMIKLAADGWAEVYEAMAPYDAALDRFINAGGFEVAGIESEADLDERIAMLDELLPLVAEVERRTRVLPERVRQSLTAAGFDAHAREGFLRGFNRAAHLDTVLEIRALDAVAFTHAREACLLLKKRWGAWHADPDTGQVIFDSEADVALYDPHAREIGAAAERQTELQRKLAEELAAPTPG